MMSSEEDREIIEDIELKYVEKGDIIEPHYHNNVKFALQRIYEKYLERFGKFVRRGDIPSMTDSLRYVVHGDWVLADDFNNTYYILKAWQEELDAQGVYGYHRSMFDYYVNIIISARAGENMPVAPGFIPSAKRWNYRIKALKELYLAILEAPPPTGYAVIVVDENDWDTAKKYLTDWAVIFINIDIPTVSSTELLEAIKDYFTKWFVLVDTQPYHGGYCGAWYHILYKVVNLTKVTIAPTEYEIYYDFDRAHFGMDKMPVLWDYPIYSGDKYGMNWTPFLRVPESLTYDLSRSWVSRGIAGPQGISHLVETPFDGCWRTVDLLGKFIFWYFEHYPDLWQPTNIIHLAHDSTSYPSWHEYPTLSETLKEWARRNEWGYIDLRE